MANILTRFARRSLAIAAILLAAGHMAGTAQAQSRPVVHYLEFQVRTGGDDLRGGNDNAFIRVVTTNGNGQEQLNRGHVRLRDYTTKTVRVHLPRNTMFREIRGFKLFVHGFRGDWHGDNWNVDAIRVTAVTEDGRRILMFNEPSLGLRFTRHNREFVQRCSMSKVTLPCA